MSDTYTVSFFWHRQIENVSASGWTQSSGRCFWNKECVEFLVGQDGKFD